MTFHARTLLLILLLPLCLSAATSPADTRPGTDRASITDTRDDEGGPDNYGHTWRNSNHPAGPAFDWVELDGVGTELDMTANEVSDPIDLGFDFPWYGEYHSSIYISTNGLVGFNAYVVSQVNQNLPNTSNPNDLIAAFWDNLDPDSNHGKVLYHRDSGRFIVEWKDVPRYPDQYTATYTFELILHDNGNILIQWEDMNGLLTSCTVGIENEDASDGLTYHCNTLGEEIADGMALMFYGPLDCGQPECENLDTEEEPNDGWDDAQLLANSIPNGVPFCGSITQGDEDWFLFHHYGGNIHLRSQISEFDAIVELYPYDPDAEPLESSDVFGRCGDEAMTGNGLNPGDYVIRLYANPDSLIEEEQGWMLTVSTVGDCCDDSTPVECLGDFEQEPNAGWMAEPANANYNELTPGVSMCGSLTAHDGNRDYDWYRFEIEEISDLHVESDATGFDMMLWVAPFDPNGDIKHVQDYAPPCCGELLNLPWQTPGEYFLVVSHNDWNGVPIAQDYSLLLELTPSPLAPACNVYQSITAGDLAAVFEGDSLVLELPAPSRPHLQEAILPTGALDCPGFDHVLELDLSQIPGPLAVRCTGLYDADELLWYSSDCSTVENACEGGVDDHGAGPGGEILTLNEAQTIYLGCDFVEAGASSPLRVVFSDASTGIDAPTAPESFALLGAFPNPFNPSTTIRWRQPAAETELRIFNLQGELVLQQHLGVLPAGSHQHTWQAGTQASGLYVYHLIAQDQSLSGKMLLLK